MSEPLNFQQVILKLHQFWADQGCVIWEPYNVQLGAGTGNPATLLRVLGPEPWRVAYVEPSVRPDDGRYGQNPNRMQKFYQYQVILKPDPGDPQEMYLRSLEALGIDPRQHDIRFVEDNWESPALGAWGLGWEVWLDGQEITQFTYFQQAGGQELDPVSVEITYGLERIVLALQDKKSVWDIDWMPGLTYNEMMFNEEVEHCKYYFELADVDALKTVYDAYEKEYALALKGGSVISAYDYVLKCSHLFNVLDTRGAIGVTERANYFRRMRSMTLEVTQHYVAKREELGFPLTRMNEVWGRPQKTRKWRKSTAPKGAGDKPADVLLEIGVEELPASDVDAAQEQLIKATLILFSKLRLHNKRINVYTTPRRLVVYAQDVAPKQLNVTEVVKGPPANRAFDEDGNPTKAAQGFARSKGIDVADLRVETIDGGEYVTAMVKTEGKTTIEVLQEALPELIAGIKFPKSMRWNNTNIAFSRPIRWITAIFGDVVIPFSYAGVPSDNVTRGLRPYGSPPIGIDNPSAYFKVMAEQGILLDTEKRRHSIIKQISGLARSVDGFIPDDPGLLDEVTNLVEAPTALRGKFDKKFLDLPPDVLVTVMRKHQRYFPVENNDGELLPYFIAVRNGDEDHIKTVTNGNEHVLQARFSDADFFYKDDIKKPLSDYLPRLATLTFQVKLGSMLDKNQRVTGLIVEVGDLFGMDFVEVVIAEHAAEIAKADLATNMVIEMTSLQGTMGREYARKSGYPLEVADVIYEHWLPRNADDALPSTPAAMLLGVTDRLDSLVGLFAAGLAPKSTADPYGLRRAALGTIQMMCGHTLDADLALTVNAVAKAQPIPVSDEVKKQVLKFIAGRLQVWLQEQGNATDVVHAILSEQSANPYRAMNGVRELSKWVDHDDWDKILDGFARCVRITRKETERYEINPDLFEKEEERGLYAAYQEAAGKLTQADNVDAFLIAFVPMLPAITTFFGTGKGDGVLVHADDAELRKNRLGLLQAISAMQQGRADLSELAGF